MNLLQSILVYFVGPALSLLVFLIFAWVIMSWLVGFGLINLRNPMVAQIYHGINRILTPIMAPFQRIIPPIGGMDLSPIVVLLLIQWAKGYLLPSLINAVG